MFGKRSIPAAQPSQPPQKKAPAPEPPQAGDAPAPQAVPEEVELHAEAPKPQSSKQEPKPERGCSEEYYDVKTTVFNALIDTIDLTQLSKRARRDPPYRSEIVSIKDVVMSIPEQEELLEDICNDVLGHGPLESLLACDGIADINIVVNGADTTYIEVRGKVELSSIRFADNAQLINICQRIVRQVGRRVDESSPICDAAAA